MKTHSAKSTKAAPQSRRSFDGKKVAGKPRGGVRKPRKKRKWTKGRRRTGAVNSERIVPEAVINAVEKAFYDWVWPEFRACGQPVEEVAVQIGLTRQGFTRVLRRKCKKMQFTTFVRACFIRRGGEFCITIAAEGWKIQLRWAIERSNSSCVSSLNGRG